MNEEKRKQKIESEYQELQNKIFIRTIKTMMGVIIGLFIMYEFFLKGNIAQFVVNWMTNFLNISYDSALRIFQQVFRDNMIFFVAIILIIVVLIVLRLYSTYFTKYFDEINRGIDALLDENSGDIILPSELATAEKKINTIKYTLEKRKREKEIAEQRKNDLVVYLAHDLKTPLTSVIGYLSLLREQGQISEELREKYLYISLEKAERLEELINEFFEITRFNLATITLEYSKVNLTRLLEQLTFEFKPMLLDKNLECVLTIVPDIFLRCDVDKMQRVFDNLLRNAVNYSFENGTINITVIQEENSLCIRFANQGNNIPKEKLDRIFEQFYRLDSARSSKSGGAGLGLAIAKEIIEHHDGTITAKSEDEMIEFEVIIPIL